MCHGQNLMPASEPLKLGRRLLVPIHSSFMATSAMEEDVAAYAQKETLLAASLTFTSLSYLLTGNCSGQVAFCPAQGMNLDPTESLPPTQLPRIGARMGLGPHQADKM